MIGHCSIGNTPCEVCKGKACIKKTPLLSSLNRLEIEKISEGVVFKDYKAGEVAQIPQGAHHRIENKTNEPVVFVEVILVVKNDCPK